MGDGDWEEKEKVVLDNGSGYMKAGFGGEDAPKCVFPAVVGRPRRGGADEYKVGDDAVSAKGYRLKYPISHGVVTDWDDMSRVWKHAYELLEVEPEDHACLMTEAPLNPRRNREKMLEILFDEFKVPALFVQIQAVLSLYEGGKTEGVVVDIGDGVSHTVPVFDGRMMGGAVQRVEIAGRDMTEWMSELLNEDQDRKFTTSADMELVARLKEKTCYFEMDFDEAYKKWEEDPTSYDVEEELPDGTKITVGRARFACPEGLFEPALMGREAKGIHHVLRDCINSTGIDCRKTLWSNIILSGGTTLFKGMEARLQKEATALAPPGARDGVQVVSDGGDGRTARKFAVWCGGALVVELASFQEQWILKSEYDELGANIVHRKCDALSGYRD